MPTLKLKAQARKIFGRKVKALRAKGVTPANIYGKKIKSIGVEVDSKEVAKIYKEAGETGLIDLIIGKTKRTVIIRNVQIHPISGQILHIDFQVVDLKEKLTASVPIELVGESPAVKQALGTLVHYIDEVEVEALPSDLPEKFEIDISSLDKVDASVAVKDIKVDSAKVRLVADEDEIVVKIDPLQKEEEQPKPAEVTEEAKAQPEGEAGKEPGAEAPKEAPKSPPDEAKKGEKTS